MIRETEPFKIYNFYYIKNDAQTRTRTGDIQIFSLTLSQLSYLGWKWARRDSNA